MLYRLAHGALARYRQAQAFVAGFLIGLSVWTPVFVATAAEETQWQQYGLPGGLVLFGAGVCLRMGGPWRRWHETRPRDPAGPSRSGMDRLAA
jgi:hypothetical protein